MSSAGDGKSVKSDSTSFLSINVLKNNLHNVLKTRWIFPIALIECSWQMSEKAARKLLKKISAEVHVQVLISAPSNLTAAAGGSRSPLFDSARCLSAQLVQ